MTIMYAYFTPEYLRTMHSISRHMRCIRTLTRSMRIEVNTAFQS